MRTRAHRGKKKTKEETFFFFLLLAGEGGIVNMSRRQGSSPLVSLASFLPRMHITAVHVTVRILARSFIAPLKRRQTLLLLLLLRRRRGRRSSFHLPRRTTQATLRWGACAGVRGGYGAAVRRPLTRFQTLPSQNTRGAARQPQG